MPKPMSQHSIDVETRAAAEGACTDAGVDAGAVSSVPACASDTGRPVAGGSGTAALATLAGPADGSSAAARLTSGGSCSTATLPGCLARPAAVTWDDVLQTGSQAGRQTGRHTMCHERVATFAGAGYTGGSVCSSVSLHDQELHRVSSRVCVSGAAGGVPCNVVRGQGNGDRVLVLGGAGAMLA